MASSTDNILANVTTSIQPTYDQTLIRQMNRHAPLLARLPLVAGKGTSVKFDISTSANTAGSMPEGYAFSVANDMSLDHYQPAELNWALYASAFSLSDLSMDAVASSVAPGDVTSDYIRSRIIDAQRNLCSTINLELYAGIGSTSSSTFGSTTAKTIVGLTPGYIDATSNVGGAITSSTASGQTYGGVARATYTTFTGSYNANSGSPATLTTKMMSLMIKDIIVKSGEVPNLIVASPGLIPVLEEIIRTSGNYRLPQTSGSFDFGPDVHGVAGEVNLSFQGIPVIMDYTLGTQEVSDGFGRLYFLNTDYLEVRTLKAQNHRDVSWFREEQAEAGSQTSVQSAVLPVKLVRLAKTGDVESFYIRSALQLVSKRPNANGWITNIAL